MSWGGIGGALIGAAGSLIGGSMTNATNKKLAYAQMNFQRDQTLQVEGYDANQAQLNRNFQSDQAQTARNFDDSERVAQDAWENQMSSTAYQRSVADMKAAGLNPILGVASGGASTPTVGAPVSPSPSGSTASIASGGSGARADMVNALGNAINTGLSAYRNIAEVEQLGVQNDKARADTALASAAAAKTAAETGQVLPAQVRNLTAESGLREAETKTQAGYPELQAAQTQSARAAAVASQAAAGASAASAGQSDASAALSRWGLGYRQQYGVEPSAGNVSTPMGSFNPAATLSTVRTAGASLASGVARLGHTLGELITRPGGHSAVSVRPGVLDGTPSAPDTLPDTD